MNVLIYAHAFAPSVGGAEAYVMLLANGLATEIAASGRSDCDIGASVTVVTRTASDDFDDATLPFHVVREPGLRQLWRLIGMADVVQLTGPVFVPLILALLRRRTVVVEHHGYQAGCPNGLLLYEPTKTACPGHFMAHRYAHCLTCNARTVGWQRSALKLLLTFPRRRLLGSVAANVSVTRHVEARLKLKRSRVIYHGIVDPIPLEQRNAVPDCATILTSGSHRTAAQPAVRFAFVGRLVSEKGLALLIEAAARLRREGRAFHVKFVGDGPERTALESMAEARGLADYVSFTGFLADVPLHRELEDVTAVVMPSIWEETAGLAAIEQMMRGRLVIAADIGGLGEIVDGAGFKFRAGDPQALAACMRRVLDEPELVSQFGAAARERAVEVFGHARMVRDHRSLYREVLDCKSVIHSSVP